MYHTADAVIRLRSEAGIFGAGFGELLRSPLLQLAEKCKFQPDSHKPGVTDPSLTQKADCNDANCPDY